jgi:gamma-glutamyltranspeptidase/glutathione hydrolase
MKFRPLTQPCASVLILALRLVLTLPLMASTARGQAAAEFRPHAMQPDAWPKQAVRGTHGMVAADEQLGSQAGVEILKRGGNAVDAAVAVAFTLAVVEPAAGNIGGGGFMLVRLADGRTSFLDYREVAPGKATRNMYIGPNGKLIPNDNVTGSVLGYRSVAVPGTVAGLELALKTYGTMKLADVMAPAIRLAKDGFRVSEKLARQLQEEKTGLEHFPVSKRIFLNEGKMLHPGDTLRQPELAGTLERIAKNGAAEFYRGDTAHGMVDDTTRNGGLITLDDLAQYQPKIREVLRAKYQNDDRDGAAHSWEVLTSPPPSSGGVAIIEALNMLKDVPLRGWDDVESVHMVAETMRRVFADRAAYLADPDFSNVPVAGLTAPCYAKELEATIDPQHASSSKTVKAGTPHPCGAAAADAASSGAVTLNDGPHTTHFSVVDAAGNAVASTYTLNDSYGSHVTSPAGFLLNDEMDDFTTQPGVPNALFGLIQSDANAIAPGHRPLSSMSPTMLLRDSQLSFVTGSPGGPTIISATLLSVINWMRLGMNAQAVINAPRFHHQWLPDQILMEQNFPEAVEKGLQVRGFATKRRGHIGLVNAIGIDPKSGERLGAADPRDNGAAVGY